MLKCNICGHSMLPNKDLHYISRGNEKTGLAAALSSNEPQLWDTFDCVWCGCQILAQKRNRDISDNFVFDNETNEEEPEEVDEAKRCGADTIIIMDESDG